MASSAIIAAAGLLAACSDNSSSPLSPATTKAPVVSNISAYAGDGQSATAGSALSVAPVVVVADAGGLPIPGVTVRFTVAAGGGSVENASAVTDVLGRASAWQWRVGSAGGQELDADVGSLPVLRFSARAVAPVVTPPASAGAYNITIRYIGGTPPAAEQAAVASAVARWQSVITKDLVDIPLTSKAAECFPSQPAVNETVDDMIIFVEFVNIDGVGKTLGESGPCYVRNDNNLPVMGHMKLDLADLQKMETVGTLNDVVLHEMGHILGIGTLWTDKSLITGSGTQEPRFTGSYAMAAYRAMGGTAADIPVENTGSAGTRDGHWRESVFGNELMTGYISGTPNPMSAMTIASLQDLGYGTSSATAAAFTLSSAHAGAVVSEPIDMHEHEHIFRPKFRIDRYGKKGLV